MLGLPSTGPFVKNPFANMTHLCRTLLITLPLAVCVWNIPLQADVGIVVYESKGVDARRTDTGHVALIVTDMCAEGIDRLRNCKEGETQGAVITRYANLAPGYEKTVFAVPVLDHFTATADPQLVPVISSGGTLEAMQMEYWRRHLKPYLPPLSQQQYEAMRAEAERFNFARTVRQVMTLEFLGTVLGAHKKHFPTEPFALIDPLTKELIPNGRWREAIGAAHIRRSTIVTTPASPDRERALIEYIQGPNTEPFNVLSDNCSDFVKGALIAVFPDAKPRFRPRALEVADAWITSPLAVATDFLSYLNREKVPMDVSVVPMMAGTRRPTASITSISRGALIPNTSQGKIAFALKVYIETLNPLLGITTIAVDQLSRFADLQRLVHERGGGELSTIANRIAADPKNDPKHSAESRQALRREQIRVFGTSDCWKAKQSQFTTVTAQAMELGVLSKAETLVLLKRGRPFLLPRIYEHAAARHANESLMAGIQDCAKSETAGTAACGLNRTDAPLASGFSVSPAGFVPSRKTIPEMSASGDRMQQIVAFKLMTSIVNYDLSSEPAVRRISERFDPDWKLFLQVAQQNGVRLPAEGAVRESVESCSCREFDNGTAKNDILGEERLLTRRLARQGRELVLGPSR